MEISRLFGMWIGPGDLQDIYCFSVFVFQLVCQHWQTTNICSGFNVSILPLDHVLLQKNPGNANIYISGYFYTS